MSRRNRNRPASTAGQQPIDLRAAARSFLAGEADTPLAMRAEALQRVVELARAEEPMVATPAALMGDRNGQGRNVRGGVAIVPLQGMITPRGSWLDFIFGGSSGGGLQGFRRRMRDALADEDVQAVVIDVHSPGGSVGLVPETARELREARGKKPIVAVANTLTASAAYWLAAQADEVIATPSGLVGSIGVYIVHQDWSGWNESRGILPTYVSAGRYKVEGNEDEPLSDEARAALQSEVDDFYALFVDDVAAGREVNRDAVLSGYGEGRVLTADRSRAADLVDRVETIDNVIRELQAGGREPGRAGARRAATSDRPGTVPPGGDNPEPNESDAASAASEEVRARIADLQALRPIV